MDFNYSNCNCIGFCKLNIERNENFLMQISMHMNEKENIYIYSEIPNRSLKKIEFQKLAIK